MTEIPATSTEPFQLAEITVRPSLNEIEGPDGPVRINPRAMEVLMALAERAGTVASKRELLDAVWSDLFVSEEVLTNSVWELRRALGDDAREPRYIQTVPRRGYRLLVTPRRIDPAQPGNLVGTIEQSSSTTAATIRRAAFWSAVVALAVLAVLLTVWIAQETPAAVVRSLAVVPIESLGDDPHDAALADGLTGTLITALARIDGLRVVSRTTSMTYRASPLTAAEIAGELGVDALVEGTLARVGDRVVLNAELIDARTEDLMWAQTYERRFGHQLDLQVEVARSVGAAIAEQLGPRGPPPSPAPSSALTTSDQGLLRWRFRTGGEIWSHPRLVDDAVLFGSRDGFVYKVALADGTERWRVKVGDQVVASPLPVEGMVVAAAHDGTVMALSAADGAELWRLQLDSTTETEVAAGPGLVVAADESGVVTAAAASSGRRVWSWHGGGGVVGLVVAEHPGSSRTVLVSRYDGAVSALDAVDGAELWHASVADWLAEPVTVSADQVLVPAPAGEGSGAVVALRTGDGSEQWRAPVPAPSAVAVWRDRVLTGGAGASLVALDRSTGDELWVYEALADVHQPVVVSAAGSETALAGSRDHNLYAIDPWSGALRFRVQMQTWITTRTVATDEVLVFGSLDGSVYCIDWSETAGVAQVISQETGFEIRPATEDRRDRGFDLVVSTHSRPRPKVRWRKRLDGPVVAAATIHESIVLAGGHEQLFALDVDDGRVRWQVKLAGAVGTAPVVLDPEGLEDVVVVGDRSGTVTAFRTIDGAEQWRFRAGADVISTPATDGESLFFGSRDGFLYALDIADGEERWRRHLDIMHASPMVIDDLVVVPSRNDTLWAVGRTDGRIRWSAKTPDWAVADPVGWQDQVLLGSCDGTVQAFSSADGRELWRLGTGGATWFRPAVARNTLFFGSGDYHVYAVDAASGTERWRRRTGNRVLSSVAVWRDLVFAGSHDRRLYALFADDGSIAWQLVTTGVVDNPTVSGDLLVVGGSDGYLYCIELSPER